MDWLGMLKKAFGTGILCSFMYHGTLLIMGQPIAIRNVAVFTVVFILLYFVWLFMVSMGKKR
ncbi:hypothetical protein [Anaerotignum sp. MB30-C6]|uniref:hypothetical protein n=1 Tax=Anaerotignum sp. MB30-C6 TaxID=3070814 RepID=UPI0027DDDA3A|nr:hypothetical protein [Anaerotignum sp. MB30-C6]WMI81522.1 hypothetical protein RBQ60_01965 [Anaerotignum sp. MB30-C6]